MKHSQKNKEFHNSLIWALFATLICLSCESEVYVPKPKIYPRITFPDTLAYQTFNTNCPFSFDYNNISRIERPKAEEPCWYNVVYPSFNAILYLSYKPLKNDVVKYQEEARSLVYNHTMKATYIEETPYHDSLKKVHGLIYSLTGNTATALQFYATDEKKHFVRGSLYFNIAPNEDSLKPVIQYIKQDIEHLVKSLTWK